MTWVFKIDDEFDGRGIAYVELGKSKIITSLLKKSNFIVNIQLNIRQIHNSLQQMLCHSQLINKSQLRYETT